MPISGVEAMSISGGSSVNEIDTTAFTGKVSLFGLGGNDVLRAGANDDLLVGGEGDDLLFGGNGNDQLLVMSDE